MAGTTKYYAYYRSLIPILLVSIVIAMEREDNNESENVTISTVNMTKLAPHFLICRIPDILDTSRTWPDFLKT